MKGYLHRGMIFGVVGFLVFAQCVPVVRADGLERLAANRLDTTFEISTNAPPLGTPTPGSGGLIIYNHSVVVPDDANVLFVTIHATGDSHGGQRLMLSCLVDDVACDPNAAFVPLAPAGWVTMQRYHNYNLNYAPGATPFFGDGAGGAGDLHDNNINYSWCTPITEKEDTKDVTWLDDYLWSGTHNIKVKLGSGPGDTGVSGADFVFLDSVRIYVDAAHIKSADRCTTVTPGM
jgi:hypothetical protein